MRITEEPTSWVVYQMTLKGQPSGMSAVCAQDDWEEMERDRPGLHTLIRAGILNEGEAEKLARGTSGDPKPRRASTISAGPGTTAPLATRL
jgi:hypothetical protein